MKLGKKFRKILILTIFLIPSSLLGENKIVTSPLLNLDKLPHAVLIGLDKITAKSSNITINVDEIKKFGPLEIKILKCGKVKVNNKIDNVAYMQVKDLTKSENDKVFIFNGWTFSSDPNMTPFDHAIYDLQLLKCHNV